MEKPKWSSSAVRHRAVRLVLEQQREHESQWAAIASATGLTLFGAIDDLWADAWGCTTWLTTRPRRRTARW